MTVEIDNKDVFYRPLAWQLENRYQTASGYGSKLTTRYKINFMDKLRRVYAICYSNSGSCYVLVNKERIFVNFDPDFTDIKDSSVKK